MYCLTGLYRPDFVERHLSEIIGVPAKQDYASSLVTVVLIVR